MSGIGPELLKPGPMVANDELVGEWIKNLDHFGSTRKRLIVLDFNFETVGPQKVAMVVPDSPILSYQVVTGDKLIYLHTETEVQPVNPNIITAEQEARLLKTGRVQKGSIGRKITEPEYNQLLKTVAGNDSDRDPAD